MTVWSPPTTNWPINRPKWTFFTTLMGSQQRIFHKNVRLMDKEFTIHGYANEDEFILLFFFNKIGIKP